ncbi:Ig-like domain-containing protein [Metabacillus fastidiosus]|uniref:Ig-like domain-containing protein n=1 Tax=Metabacillus fastidiosus TaxID=1458 RepID=UPI003D28B2BB
MKKFLVVLTAIVIIFGFSLASFIGIDAKAATVGDQLTEPESGWKRYDDVDSAIKYSGNVVRGTDPNAYKGTYTQNSANTTVRTSISFDFVGTQFRIISAAYLDKDPNTEVSIDGVVDGSFNAYLASGRLYQKLVYEKTGLENKRHTVTITKSSANTKLTLDAIDIDDTGSLLAPGENLVTSLTLNKEKLDLYIGSSEALVATITPEDASNKTIKWTSSDPEIATVDDNGNVIGKKVGKVTITAATMDGSNLIATCEVTVKETEIVTNRAVLKLVTTPGNLHEYDLPMTEINKFISWLDGREQGQGKPYYIFKLNVTTGNVTARTEYIMYDKIVSFVVDEYK